MEIKPDLVIAPLPSTQRGFGLHLSGRLNKTPCLVYGNQQNVVLRGIGKDDHWSAINSQHAFKVNVAKFSPNGEWVCSGDDSGQIFVWAHSSFVVKNQITVGKRVTDIAYSSDGQRIAAVGAGKDDKGKVFPWNTNNKLGELTGCAKDFLTCDFKPTRPFKVVTGSQSNQVHFYKGPPFVFEGYDRTHKNYVNCVRFTPDGKHYVSVSSDKLICVFDSKDGSLQRKIKSNDAPHTGTIYSLSFNKDGSKFITSSADKSCKIWDFNTGCVLKTITFGDMKDANLMQITCLWLSDEHIYSVSLNGNINLLSPQSEKPIKVYTGHKKSITDVCYNEKLDCVYTCDVTSRVIKTEMKNGECSEMGGINPHGKTQLKFVRVSKDGNALYTVAVDDCLCISKLLHEEKQQEAKFEWGADKVKLDGATKGMCCGHVNNDMIICVTHKKKVFVVKKGVSHVKENMVTVSPTCLCLSSDDTLIAIGSEEKKVVVYQLGGDGSIVQKNVVQHDCMQSEILAVDFSRDLQYLAVTDRRRHIWIFGCKDLNGDPLNLKTTFQYHHTVVNSMKWNQDSTRLLSVGCDGQVYLWTCANKGKAEYERVEHAHISAIKQVEWVSQNKFVTVGDDASIRFWNVLPAQKKKKLF